MSESELVNPSQLSTKLEAILYLKAQPLTIQDLADYAFCEVEDVEEALLILMQDYALRNSALEVVESNAGFSLQLREAYMSLVQTIVPTDLGVGALRTLAAIALKGPIPQTQLVELRGSGAYQHVGDLAEEGFVSKRRQSNGRSYSVQVTEKFYQYFEVDELPKLKLKKTARQRRIVEEGEPTEQPTADTESTQQDPIENQDNAVPTANEDGTKQQGVDATQTPSNDNMQTIVEADPMDEDREAIAVEGVASSSSAEPSLSDAETEITTDDNPVETTVQVEAIESSPSTAPESVEETPTQTEPKIDEAPQSELI